jgi:DNA-formamidopyrimidine glycosylase
MTEGPEATHLANYISKRFLKKKLRNIKILAGRYKTHGPPHGFKDFLKALPTRLVEVFKKGKVLFLIFDNGWTLISKMGMVGWFYTEDDLPLYKNEAHVRFEFDGQDLIFADFRNFGTLYFTNSLEEVLREVEQIAPDVLDAKFSDIEKRVGSLKQSLRIEDVMMDQSALFSGVGNIIKSEALYQARISPKRHLADLTSSELRAIFMAAKAYARRVVQILDSAKVHSDQYEALQKVYQRTEDPQGRRITSYKSASGRTTFYVPAVQK